ncbi:MAG: Mur ligase domain-containing protein, partial [Syntrophobacteraceae bacterium]
MKDQSMVWTPALLAEAAHGEVLSGNAEAEIHAIATDTRKLAPGYCFIALTGENHDGHDFVEDAVRKGAGAVIVSRWEWQLPDGCAVITVSDTLT